MAYQFKIFAEEKELKQEYKILQKNDIDYIHFNIEQKELQYFPELELRIESLELVDTHSLWQPTAYRNKNLSICWGDEDQGEPVKGTVSAPIAQYFSAKSKNRLTIACSEVLETILFKAGVKEEDGTAIVKLRFFTHRTRKRKKISGLIRLDMRDIRMEDSLREAAKWYEEIGYKPMKSCPGAKEAMYSTWYSYHQNLTAKDIEQECRRALELGCKGIIVDDGWQTRDTQRGYAFTGDWEPCAEKMGDMEAHIQRVHQIGLKYLLWYSVPYIGEYSKNWGKFADKLLYRIPKLKCGVLDPRYKEVRNHLVEVFKKALIDWNLDGFKLDFIDEFDISRATGKALEDDNRRDFNSVQEGVENLLSRIKTELLKIKSDLLIEFRQKYIGPFVRQFGNILRVADCALDYIANRNGIVDLRLFSGNTAVHSDMIMWNYRDTTESAALQIINILYGVPQISLKLYEIREDHYRMLKHWLGFWKKYKDILLNGQLYTNSMENNNIMLSSIKDNINITTVFSKNVVRIVRQYDLLIIVNGKLSDHVFINIEENIAYSVEIFNTFGQKVNQYSLKSPDSILRVPKAGYAVLKIDRVS